MDTPSLANSIIFSDASGRQISGSSLRKLALFGSVILAAGSLSADPARLLEPRPGGIDPRPMMRYVTNAAGAVRIWGGGYQGGPFRMVVNTNLSGGAWTAFGPTFTNNSFYADAPYVGDSAFYRLSGPLPIYASAATGPASCSQCHSIQSGGTIPDDVIYDYWAETPHARAFQALVNSGAGNATNASCLPCHTVGYGIPGGYTIGNTALEGVQCESCHGPGGVRHRGGGSKLPALERSAMLCGGCHNNTRYRTYDEWKDSPHARVEPQVAALMADPVEGPANTFRCGSCHSGAMHSYLTSLWIGTPPDGESAGREGVVCVGCHDPHRNTPAGHQLVSPLFSTNAYSLPLVTNRDGFFKQYRAEVNLCGQCHNARGAAWTDTARAPHGSPQYNLLVGAIGEFPSGPAGSHPGAHALLITNQCLGCHMTVTPVTDETHPGNSGHAFALNTFDSCQACHPEPELIYEFATSAVSDQIQDVKSWLDYWAANKAPAALRNKYGSRAWEFTTPGALSNPAGVTTPGPSTAEQAQIPDAIKKARYNLYLVQQDGSLGVHNGPFAIDLLDAARSWIQIALHQ